MSVLSLLIHATLSNAIHKNSCFLCNIRALVNHHVNSIGLIILLLCIFFTIFVDLYHLPSVCI